MNDKEQGMSLIVKTAARFLVGMVFLYGIYIVSHGHISPGGGFAGGVIIALSFMLLMIAFGREAAFKKLPKAVIAFFESMGAIIFLGIALFGFVSGYFFLNFISKGEPFRLFSAGIMPLCNLVIGIKVGTGVFAIFVALILLKLESEERNK